MSRNIAPFGLLPQQPKFAFCISNSIRKSRREFVPGKMTDFSLAQPGIKWLLEISRVQNIEKTCGNVNEATRDLSRSDLPRLYPAASVAAWLPVDKSINAFRVPQLIKQMLNRWESSLGSLKSQGKYCEAEALNPEISGEMSIPLIAIDILLDLVVFPGVKYSLVSPQENVLFRIFLPCGRFFSFSMFSLFCEFL